MVRLAIETDNPMRARSAPDPASEVWLHHFSQPDAWREGQSEALIEKMLGLAADQAIHDVARELDENGFTVDETAWTDLLRHWTKINLGQRTRQDERRFRNPQKAAAKRLSKALREIDDVLDADPGGLIHALSLRLGHPMRIHHGRALCEAMQASARELLPAAEAVSAVSLKRGPRKDRSLRDAVDGLTSIFEFMTGKQATRTYDAAAGGEIGAFHAFVERCLRMLDPEGEQPVNRTIRTVLEDRRRRAAALARDDLRPAGLNEAPQAPARDPPPKAYGCSYGRMDEFLVLGQFRPRDAIPPPRRNVGRDGWRRTASDGMDGRKPRHQRRGRDATPRR